VSVRDQSPDAAPNALRGGHPTQPPRSGLASRSTQLEAVVDALPDAIAVVDASGVVQVANPTAAALFGFLQSEIENGAAVLGKNVLAPTSNLLAAALASVVGQPGAVATVEVKVRGSGDSQRLVVVTLRDAHERSEVGGVVVSARDVTAERTRAAREERAQRLESSALIAGGTAHDVNNALAVIVACASNLLDTVDPEEARVDAAAILEASARASALTKRLNAFVALQRRELRPTAIDAELGAMVAKLAAQHPDVSVSLVVESALPPVYADLAAVEQTLLELVTNAVEAVAKRIVVRVSTRTVIDADLDATGRHVDVGPYLAISVEDDGRGMSAAVLDRAFEPFFTTKPHVSGQRAGLGLSAVYGVARRHRGALYADSEVGRGSRVTILFRVANMAETEDEPRSGRPGPRRRLFVVVVDDEPMVGASVSRLLERRGFEVAVCTKPGDALRAVTSGPAGQTVLLSDVIMPVMSGVELALEARRHVPNLPVLLMSGYLGAHDAAGAGFDVIAKPFDAQTLADRLLATVDAIAAQTP